MTRDEIVNWLLEGDYAIQYQTYRDLLNEEKTEIQKMISDTGWGAAFLSRRNPDGHWGRRFYQPKWISTHYTLLDFRNLEISPDSNEIRESINLVLKNEKGTDGGIDPSKTRGISDVCVSGMSLNYASYFETPEQDLQSIVDYLLAEKMGDGGFNCRTSRSGAVHSSLHSTISVLEGILAYKSKGYTYRLNELLEAEKTSQEFILQHRLFKSDKTGEIIDKKMLMLSYPTRWKYDILRALDYFQASGRQYDSRVDDAVQVLMKKQRKDGRWPVQAKHPGEVHFDMEKSGEPSRWNTLRALRVLKWVNCNSH